MSIILEDWQKLINNSIDVTGFMHRNWKLFEPVYHSVFKTTDDADLYILLDKCITKMIKQDIVPDFKYEGQFFQYIKSSLFNEKMQRDSKSFDSITDSLDTMQEDYNYDVPDDTDYVDELLSLFSVDETFKELQTRLSEGQMKAVMLLYQGYTREECALMLGITVWSLNDRIWRARETVKQFLKHED